jgi:cytochrome c553
MRLRRLVVVSALVVLWPGILRADDGVAFFEKKVRPVFVEHCYKCHSAKAEKLKGGLRLDTIAGIRKGGDTGPLFVAGKPKESLLVAAIRHEDMSMPPTGKLPEALINDVVTWVERGAALPSESAGGLTPRREAFRITPDDRAHWAFRPLKKSTDADIDRFLQSRLQAAGLASATPADKYTLLRRATYDLTGLPPTVEQIRAFVADESPEAFARVVDRLLASKEFGAHWGRHWLDGVRYATDVDKSGQYRDWVVRSLNEDLPYHRFVMLQLAGDLLPADTKDSAKIHVSGASLDGVVASGMLALAVWELVGRDLAVAEIVDSQIDVVGRQLLGLTLACARCHDHKFDPVSTEDYYGLAGILFSSKISPGNLIADGRLSGEVITVPLLSKADDTKNRKLDAQIKELTDTLAKVPGAEKLEKFAREIEAIDAKIKATKVAAEKTKLESELSTKKKEEQKALTALDVAAKKSITELRGRIAELRKHKVTPPQVMVTQDGGVPGSNREKIADAPVLIRGDFRREGSIVPRRFPIILAGDQQSRIANGSGRLELAKWIASPKNPLTSRVMANRIWLNLFGEGLVRTPDNFGRLGEPPTHPELLDYLAERFVGNGWSVKKMIRELVLTRAYRQSSAGSPEQLKADPDNLLVGRMNRKRLTYESLRDSLLFVSGQLSLTPEPAAGRAARTMFEPIERRNGNDMRAMFDGPDPKGIVADRADTTTAPQALFMLNNKMVLQAAEGVGTIVAKDWALKSDAAKLDRVYLQLIGRPPSAQEKEIALAYIQSASWPSFLQVLLCTNEFIYVD